MHNVIEVPTSILEEMKRDVYLEPPRKTIVFCRSDAILPDAMIYLEAGPEVYSLLSS